MYGKLKGKKRRKEKTNGLFEQQRLTTAMLFHSGCYKNTVSHIALFAVGACGVVAGDEEAGESPGVLVPWDPFWGYGEESGVELVILSCRPCWRA